ncbi:structural maintenance of [Stylonychia lemnae]|uniref:Structural maintenance of chromosomes protein n=1 Tax=Stylonychia lemnae TaxID=5949 RepID=A0A077ZNB8_STYLE|nr:structural maintenance of [Stylonychia lemnae]|eukprot:CDW71413.1 structural maintenance of [Stylonychia lemnae]
MYILEITLDGFKSYSVRTVIDKFDPQFNAITGLNGSGKSNILDAICFVLGISQLANVRAEKLQELVYKQGNSGVTKATVTITFDNSNKDQSPPGYSDLNKISVTRTVENQKSKYYINGSTSTAEKVKSLFCSVKLNVNNPHFLIMQGRVTKVINMKPMEILGLIEEAAGISLYQNKKDQTMALIRKKDAKLQEIDKILEDDVNPQLEQLRKDKEEYALFKSNEGLIQENEKILVAYEYFDIHKFLSGSDRELEKKRNERLKYERDITNKTQEVETLKVQLSQIQKQTNSTKEEETLKRQINGIEKSILTESLEMEKLQNSERAFLLIQKEAQTSIDKLQNEINKLIKKITDIDSESLGQIEKDIEQKKDQIRDLEKEVKMIKEGKDNKGSAQEAINKAMTLYQNEIKLKTNVINDAEKDFSRRQNESKTFEKDIQVIKAEIQKIERQIDEKKYELSEYQNMREDKHRIERQIHEIEGEINKMGQVSNLYHFNYRVPHEQFDKRLVCGKLLQLFKIQDSKYEQALEAAAGGKLYNVVVQNERVSKELIQNKCVGYNVTYIPLNVIRSDTPRPDIVQRIKELTQGKARLAKELIEYDPKFEPAMNFAFGNVFVADDEETAKKVSFNNFAKFLCVTLKGDKYNPMGTLEGGYQRNASMLSQIEKYRVSNEKRSELAMNRDELDKKMKRVEQTQQFVDNLKHQMQLKQHEYNLKEQRAREYQQDPMDSQRLKALQDEVEDLKEKINEIGKNEKELLAEIANYKQEIKNLDNAKGNDKEKYFIDKIKQSQQQRDALQKKLASIRDQKNTYEIKIDENKQEIAQYTKKVEDEQKRLQKEISDMPNLSNSLIQNQKLLEQKRAELEKCEGERAKANKDLEVLTDKKLRKEKEIDGLQVELKDHNIFMKKYEQKIKDYENAMNEMLGQHKWIEQERDFFGVAGHKYHFEKINMNQIRDETRRIKDENDGLKKRINLKVDAMFEKTEQQYQDLQKKKETTMQNKAQFEATIAELDELKNVEVERTYKAVNKYCSEIFSTLLQGAMAKLVPPEGKTVLEGLELKVGFSGSWKESLSELSGGQRSLLALSLILALLKYHPAPLYILDEIDSALDLSHTQNIGIMIRKFFQNSQFIIVSLKEGLFQNANVLFKVQFVDSRSTVKRFQVRKGNSGGNENMNDQSMMIQQSKPSNNNKKRGRGGKNDDDDDMSF